MSLGSYSFAIDDLLKLWELFGKYANNGKLRTTDSFREILKLCEIGPVGSKELEFAQQAIQGTPETLNGVGFAVLLKALSEFGKRGRRQSRNSGLRKFSAKEVFHLQQLFAEIDADKDGKISFQEFYVAMGHIDKSVTPKDVNAVLKRIEPSSKGFLSFPEFLRGLSYTEISNFDSLHRQQPEDRPAARQGQRNVKDDDEEEEADDDDDSNFASLPRPLPLSRSPIRPPPKPSTAVATPPPIRPSNPIVGERKKSITEDSQQGSGKQREKQTKDREKEVKPAQVEGTVQKGSVKKGTTQQLALPSAINNVPNTGRDRGSEGKNMITTKALSQNDKPLQTSNQLPPLSDKFMEQAIQAFNVADEDHSGGIDQHELYDLLQELFGHVTLPESNRIYHEMDTNRSGTVTFDEFLAALVKYKWDTSHIQKHPHGPAHYDWEIPFQELALEKKLGEGTFGVVWSGKWRGTHVAVKQLKMQKNQASKEVVDEFKKEIDILGKLRHPNVILYMGACTQFPNLAMITEFLPGGSVFDLLHTKKEKFDLQRVLSLAKQTSFGLNYLHLSGILHRDLKSMNLLVDKHYNLKLCDFGLSCVKPKNKPTLTEQVGTPLWMAPEMLLNQEYNESADVYSYGICVWEFLTGEIPYSTLNYEKLINQVAKGGSRPNIPSSCPHGLSRLIKSCWDSEPKKRPNCANIIAHLERIASHHPPKENK